MLTFYGSGGAAPAERPRSGSTSRASTTIGAVSWLTMARAIGVGPGRTLRVRLLPNLAGPIIVYTTLTGPAAILQESFLSSLGIGVQAPLPSWGNLAADGLDQLDAVTAVRPSQWGLVVFPCLLWGMTLMALNFLGDALRRRLDPRGG